MKPVMKDAPRQERRRRTLARLEAYLKGGVRSFKVQGTKNERRVIGPLPPEHVTRIQGEIATLKQRLGIV